MPDGSRRQQFSRSNPAGTRAVADPKVYAQNLKKASTAFALWASIWIVFAVLFTVFGPRDSPGEIAGMVFVDLTFVALSCGFLWPRRIAKRKLADLARQLGPESEP